MEFFEQDNILVKVYIQYILHYIFNYIKFILYLNMG